MRDRASRPPRRPEVAWWVATRNSNGRTEVLTVVGGHGEALPVFFSGEGEADMFVWLGGAHTDGWRIAETRAGEILSILHGPCAGAKMVALDPSPEIVAREAIELACLNRDRFVECLMDGGSPRLSPDASHTPVGRRPPG